MEKTLSEELNEMANEELNKNDVSLKKRKFKRVFFSLLIIGAVAAVTKLIKYSIAQSQAEERAAQNKKQAEEDDNCKHWPNEVIIFHQDDYEQGTKLLRESNKPHVFCKEQIGYAKNGVKQEGFLVTEELGWIIKKSGLRYQVGFIDHSKSCFFYQNLELEIKSYKWINW